MKKISCIVIAILMMILVAACNPETGEDKDVQKTPEGIPYIFTEYEGYYNSAPSIIEFDNQRYVIYNTNKEKNIAKTVIAARKGTMVNGKWEYGEQKIILEPTAGKWDSVRVANADIVEGNFSYKNKEYKYLLAYQGNGIEAEKRFQIGLAVSNDILSGWVKVENPFIPYDYNVEGDTYGYGHPSMINFDKQSKILFFYSSGTALLTSTRFVEADLSDLDNPVVSGYITVPVNGLPLDGMEIPMVANADFAYDEEEEKIFMVKDGYPYASSAPQTATKVSLAKIDLIDLYTVDGQWKQVVPEISSIDTATEGNTGWKRIHSACILTDAFGNIDSSAIDVGFTSGRPASSAEDRSYIFYDGLHIFSVPDLLRIDL